MFSKSWWRACASVSCVCALWMSVPAHAGEAGPLVVATYAYPQRDRIAAIRPLADYLAERSGRAVETKLLPSPTALIEAMARGEVDVAVPNLHGYLQSQRWQGRIVAVAVPDVPPAQAGRYRAVIVARAGIDSFDALKREAAKLRLVLVGPDSASGGFIPVGRLKQLGLDPATRFAALAYAGSHAAALQALDAGRADVAALAADVFDAQAPAKANELWRSAPIPPSPLACRTQAIRCAEVGEWLLDAHRRDPRVMTALRAGWPEFGDATAFVPPPAVPDELVLD